MDIKKLNEDIANSLNENSPEDIARELEVLESRRLKMKRIYGEALDGLDELHWELKYLIDIKQEKVDKDTEQFYDLITKCVNEIRSRRSALDR